MKTGSKKHEIRKQELIEIATELFVEKGYEAVSVRDILNIVNGAQGMFYHYFKSKQDIYIAAMSQYIDRMIEERVSILNDEGVPFPEKRDHLRELLASSFADYLKIFGTGEDDSVESDAHRIRIFVEMLDKLHMPYANFILQGLRVGQIPKDTGINESNANIYALFVLYGIFGVLHNDTLNRKEPRGFGFKDIFPVIENIFFPHSGP
ncbi:transcriptional regulator, TetR family [Syntrophobotulus glycolicus DSM 8271]|uniref:Transcriptional regulator, TetR family n=1 Tax=Syntrophobotulus glycolicus (strain DSM 8271 / FlGlyR) TaxID=645991 RepID=F0SWV9_SYNGF|nr:TetR/AcrR family transcriptional regulator [Syntrophobotulus glycolicus]ADY54649.1 transcriptional regulator, TetR family [Syntrophobotulus glycolicus DSM 8271]